MDISAIIKSIFEAKKIGGMTIAALALSFLFYFYSEKIGVVESEDKVGALIILFTIILVFIVVLVFLYGLATTKMRYEHEDRKQDRIQMHNQKEVKKAKNQKSTTKKINPSSSKKSFFMNNQTLKNLVNQQNFVALFETLDPFFAGDNADYQYSNIKQNILHEMQQNKSPSPTQIQSLLVFLNSEKVTERLEKGSKENQENTDNATYIKSNVIKGDNNGNITNNFS